MKLIIYGNSDFAELMHHYFTSYSKYEVVAFCVDKEYKSLESFLDKPLIAFEDLENLYPKDDFKVFIAVGYKSMRVRKKLYDKVKTKGYSFANFISPNVIFDDTNIIGDNNALLHNVVLEPFSKIGNNNILNTGNTLCHHAVIYNDCFIAANCTIGGYTTIKNNCFIGFSSTILQKLVLEDETLVAAGSIVNTNSSKYDFLAGTPARCISNHKLNGIEVKG